MGRKGRIVPAAESQSFTAVTKFARWTLRWMRRSDALLADSVTVGQLAGLVTDGFATMRASLVRLDGRGKSVIWMKITEAGQAALVR
jgi:hypothetical protein